MTKKIKDVMFFSNGNTAVFDEQGKQMPELHKSWALFFIEFIQSKGGKITKETVIRMPNEKEGTYSKKYHHLGIKEI